MHLVLRRNLFLIDFLLFVYKLFHNLIAPVFCFREMIDTGPKQSNTYIILNKQ